MPASRLRPPPAVDFGEHLVGRRPAVDRQAERRLGDEGVAADRLERRTGRVRGELVVARDDPDLAAMFQPHLGRAEDVTGRVKRDADAVVIDRLAVGQGVDDRVVAEAGAEDVSARLGAEVLSPSQRGRGRRGRG